MKKNAILIFDIGKTNKKRLLFDEDYHVIDTYSTQFTETTDQDGFPCEDIYELTSWIRASVSRLLQRQDLSLRAVNFSAYGASFVCVDEHLSPVCAMCNYLKPFPAGLQQSLYEDYGGSIRFATDCASPALGNLNSGLQLYQLRRENPVVYKKIAWALHLPQYISAVITNKPVSEITSIGCHTSLWNFAIQQYHRWVTDEGIDRILAPILPADTTFPMAHENKSVAVGIGLHDSSAALVPYLLTVREPFLLLSTGTWNISMNPFNNAPLTDQELKEDCLCYLNIYGRPVKSSRLFAGNMHDQQIKILSEKFHVVPSYFEQLAQNDSATTAFTDLPAIAYLEFLKKLASDQEHSTRLVLGENVKTIFVDGGFSRNPVFMRLLAERFKGHSIFAASIAQASALGAAIAIHKSWNTKPIPQQLVELKQIDAPNRL